MADVMEEKLATGSASATGKTANSSNLATGSASSAGKVANSSNLATGSTSATGSVANSNATEVKTDYAIDYGDQRFTDVNTQKTTALDELEKTYSGMIGESDKYYQEQIDASNKWAEQQKQLQQEQTDFAIDQIEQQKEQAHSDYLKDQSGAYVDWQKQSNKYGAEAERQATTGMNGTGYSESAQVSMYNTYQNRVATARESYNRAVLNYDNAIKDARLQNNATLAEIAYQALQQQLELSLQGFQYKNTLLLDKANKKLEVENNYYNRYLDVLNQINTENALSETIRQFNEEQALKQAQLAEEQRQFNFVNKLGEFAVATPSYGGGGGGSGGGDDGVYIPKKTGKTETSNDNPNIIVGDGVPKVYSGAELEKRVNSGEYKTNIDSKGNVVITKNNGVSDMVQNTINYINNVSTKKVNSTPATTGSSSALGKVIETINRGLSTVKKYN